MKRLLLSFIITVSTMLSTVWAYDFSVVVPSGQTLYFDTISSTKVRVTYPKDTNKFDGGYLGYAMLQGIWKFHPLLLMVGILIRLLLFEAVLFIIVAV